MADTQVQEGDKASWNWNGNKPSETAAEIEEGDTSIKSNRGNVINTTGDTNDPAAHNKQPGNDVAKESEMEVDSKTNGNGNSKSTKEVGTEKKEEEKKETIPETEEAKTGEKRKADEKIDDVKQVASEEKEDAAKKQKTTNGNENGTSKKGPGRPKGSGTNGAKKEKKVPAVGRAERKTRSQGAV